ncbi:hypothetical protein [Nocardia sp. SSK8]|uniref:hypothetical protein n=1 Tax=Nocardia sp. SSK8 TaxID=3120154 RepID=UPI0030085A88
MIAAWTGAVVVAIAAAAISIHLNNRASTPTGSQPLESVQAGFPVDWLYTTTNEVIVGSSGGRQLNLPLAVSPEDVVWTNDGSQAVVLTNGASDEPGSLIVVHAAAGRIDRYRCEDCQDIFARGTSSVITTGSSSGLNFLFRSWTFAENAVVEDLSTQVPTTDNRLRFGGWTNLIASHNVQHEGFKLGLYTFDGSHAIEYTMDNGIGQVAVGSTAADSTVVAASPAPDLPGWYCEQQPEAIVQLLTPDGARVSVPEPSSLASIDTADIMVNDIWWESGSFRASFGSISCRETESSGELSTNSAADYSFGTIGNFQLNTESLQWEPERSPKNTSPRYIERAGSTNGGGEYSHVRACGIFGAADTMHCDAGTLTLTYSGTEYVIDDVVAFRPRPEAAGVSRLAQAVSARTQCDVVSPTGQNERIADLMGDITCTEARTYYLEYRSSPPATGGNINWISNERWSCSMPTAGTFASTGRVASCESPESGQWSFRVQAVK